jgi:hypothetical protein
MPRLPDTITFSEIADALDTLVDISDRMDELACYNASFWRDAALRLRWLDEADHQQEAALIDDVLREILEEVVEL